MAGKYDRIVSADSHVNEPVDLWVKAMGDKYGDSTPRLVDEFNGEKGRFFFTGLRVMKLADDEKEITDFISFYLTEL